jgi:hypothetical protein
MTNQHREARFSIYDDSDRSFLDWCMTKRAREVLFHKWEPNITVFKNKDVSDARTSQLTHKADRAQNHWAWFKQAVRPWEGYKVNS